MVHLDLCNFHLDYRLSILSSLILIAILRQKGDLLVPQPDHIEDDLTLYLVNSKLNDDPKDGEEELNDQLQQKTFSSSSSDDSAELESSGMTSDSE